MIRNYIFIILTLFISHDILAQGYTHAPQKLYYGHNELYKKPDLTYNPYIINSKYDFSDIAYSITYGCKNDYEKICAIYKWICDNISYDTDYEIYDADRCWEERKGVCQAYCNLFYHIAKSIDIRVEIIGGKSKDFNGYTNDGHGWIFAYTKKDYGILLDPTWGAGNVNGKEFIKSKDCWIWFNISPEWMILSHFPNDTSYQFIKEPISYNKFLSLPPVNSIWINYGMKHNKIYLMAMNDELSLPTFYGEGEGKFQFIDFPLQESLKIGEFYTLRVRMASNCDIAIINEDIFIRKKEWKYEGNNTYSIKFMPRKVGTINFGLQDHDNHWNCIIEYNIDAPTSNDWNNLKQHYPLNTPTANNIENLYEKEWENAGIDNHKLIELIERHNVKELPIIYTNMGKYFRIISIPMTKKLKKEQSYTFIIKPTDGKNWAIVNGDEWNYDWHTSNDGTLTMTIKPKQSGNLVIYAQFGQDSRYSGCIGYSVE